jgi:hypothetical protein
VAAEGLVAPPGYLWCRGRAGQWHLLVETELVDRKGNDRESALSVCGLWASLRLGSGDKGWAQVTKWATPAGAPLAICPKCAAVVADARRRDREVTPPAEQGRLF